MRITSYLLLGLTALTAGCAIGPAQVEYIYDGDRWVEVNQETPGKKIIKKTKKYDTMLKKLERALHSEKHVTKRDFDSYTHDLEKVLEKIDNEKHLSIRELREYSNKIARKLMSGLDAYVNSQVERMVNEKEADWEALTSQIQQSYDKARRLSCPVQYPRLERQKHRATESIFYGKAKQKIKIAYKAAAKPHTRNAMTLLSSELDWMHQRNRDAFDKRISRRAAQDIAKKTIEARERANNIAADLDSSDPAFMPLFDRAHAGVREYAQYVVHALLD